MRRIIGIAIAGSPCWAVLIAAGISTEWWLPLAMICFLAVVAALAFVGFKIYDGEWP